MDSPFELTVYDKAFQRLGWVGDARSLHMTVRHNGQSSGAVRVAAGSDAVEYLSEPGARYVLAWRGEFLSSGVVRLTSAEGSAAQRELTFQLSDDYRILTNTLGWQSPASAIGSTPVTQPAEHDVRTGSAEAVLKGFVTANAVTRLGRPLTVATNLNRGSTITVQSRMDKLTDGLFPLVDQAGIGVTVRQVGAGLVLDCYTPATFPIDLSEEGGTLDGVAWDLVPPDVTRVVVQGPGDGVAREHVVRINAAAEALYGDVIEQATDARDVKADDPNKAALMQARGDEVLAAGAARSGFKLTLSDTETFRYGGDGVRVGDRIRAEIAPGNVVEEILREATLTFNLDGPSESLVAGERENDPDARLYRQLSDVTRDVRRLRTGR